MALVRILRLHGHLRRVHFFPRSGRRRQERGRGAIGLACAARRLSRGRLRRTGRTAAEPCYLKPTAQPPSLLLDSKHPVREAVHVRPQSGVSGGVNPPHDSDDRDRGARDGNQDCRGAGIKAHGSASSLPCASANLPCKAGCDKLGCILHLGQRPALPGHLLNTTARSTAGSHDPAGANRQDSTRFRAKSCRT